MRATDTIEWDEVEGAATKMFNVWVDGTELKWAEEAWGHLTAAGLTGATTILDITAAKLRLVTLARIYQEFSGFAWDENPETPLDYLAEDLEIDPVALGILAGRADPNDFEDLTWDEHLLGAALVTVTDSQRKEIFECLRNAYGDEFRLYSRLWRTRSLLAEEDSEADEWEVTGVNSSALEYVSNGFRR
jgi:hypothetical protein